MPLRIANLVQRPSGGRGIKHPGQRAVVLVMAFVLSMRGLDRTELCDLPSAIFAMLGMAVGGGLESRKFLSRRQHAQNRRAQGRSLLGGMHLDGPPSTSA